MACRSILPAQLIVAPGNHSAPGMAGSASTAVGGLSASMSKKFHTASQNHATSSTDFAQSSW